MALVVVLGLVGHVVLGRSFEGLECFYAKRNVSRARDALDARVEAISVKLGDWSNWDDTCKFIEDRNQAFVDANLEAKSIASLKIDFMLFYDAKGELADARVLADDEHFVEIVPGAIASTLESIGGAVGLAKDGDVRSGLVVIGGRPALFCARPILDSNGEGPSHGVLIFGDFVDDEEQEFIERFTKCPVTLSNIASDGPMGVPIEDLAAAEKGIMLSSGSDGTRKGWVLLRDIHGEPAIVAELMMDRPIYEQGLATQRYMLYSVAGGCVVIGVICVLFLSRRVLRRLDRLAFEVFAAHQSLDIRMSDHGNDEIGELAEQINEMLVMIQESQRELISARRAAESANTAKSEFLSTITHEIRSPMTAVIGYADLLMEAGTSQEQRRDYAERIKRSGQHLLGVINDILDASKIEAGAMTIEQVPCSPAQIIDDARSMFESKAGAAGIELTSRIDDHVPALIATDPLRLRQVLVNLVSNAMKFTSQGSVTIDADLASDTMLRVRVRDTGIGITPAQASALFSPFTQADSSTSRRFGGTGLGLTISRKLARLMGGDITAESVPGEGSVFTMTIRFASVDPEPASAATMTTRPASVCASLAGVRVLLVDDAEDNLRLNSHFLTKAGATVFQSSDGEDALRQMTEGPDGEPAFDVVLMDMQMPVCDGYEATRRARRAGYRAPILALTAHMADEERRRCLDAGCDDFLNKPIDRAKLTQTVLRWARRDHVAAIAGQEKGDRRDSNP